MGKGIIKQIVYIVLDKILLIKIINVIILLILIKIYI